MKKFIAIGLSIMALLLSLFLFNLTLDSPKDKPVSNDNTNKGEIKKTEQSTGSTSDKNLVWVFDHSIDVDFGSEFGDIVYSESGLGMSFSQASEPYDVINSNGEKGHGEKGEDASPQLPPSGANTRLKFKSSNGKTGHLKIMLFRFVEKQANSNKNLNEKII